MAAKPSKAQLTLTRILDAALDCYGQNGIAATTLEDVAKQAEIGRTTLYRYVNNRDDLLQKVVLRDADQQHQEMQVLARYHDNLEDNLVESIVYILRGRRTRPINVLLFGSGDSAVIDRINLSPANFYPMAESSIKELFERAQREGQIRDGVTLPMVSQWVARLILSLITYPEEFLEDEQALRNFLQAFLVPSIIRQA